MLFLLLFLFTLVASILITKQLSIVKTKLVMVRCILTDISDVVFEQESVLSGSFLRARAIGPMPMIDQVTYVWATALQ